MVATTKRILKRVGTKNDIEEESEEKRRQKNEEDRHTRMKIKKANILHKN